MQLRMPLKIFMALAAATAIVVGFALPVSQKSEASTSQFELLEVGRG